MSYCKVSTRTFTAILALTAVLPAVVLLLLGEWRNALSIDPATTLALLTLVIAANYRTLDFGGAAKLTFDTAATVAAILLLSPGLAITVVGVGVALGRTLRRSDPDETVFNSAQTALQAAAGAGVLAFAGWTFVDFTGKSARELVPIIGALAAVYVVNTVLLGMMIALDTGASPISILVEVGATDAIPQLIMMSLGLLSAIISDLAPWALLLLLIPIAAAHKSSRMQDQIHSQPRMAVEALADLLDSRDPRTAGHSLRVAKLARRTAVELKHTPRDVEVIESAGRFHDIGSTVLHRSSLESAFDWDADARRHVAETGTQMLARFPQFAPIAPIVANSYQRFDEYALRVAPRRDRHLLAGRIIAVANAYDAMLHPPSSGKPLTSVAACDALRAGAGTYWDPQVVEALVTVVNGDLDTSQDIRNPDADIARSGLKPQTDAAEIRIA